MTFNRKWLALILFTVVLFAACQSTHQTGASMATNPSHIDRIMAAGELRVVTSGAQPPLNMKDRDGQVFGFEVDLARMLAAKMGVELRLVEKPFSEILDALQAGEADIAISGLTMLTMRNMKVAFAGPYFISGKSFLTKYQNLADAKRIDAVDVKDVTLTALKGSTSQMLVEEVIPEVKLIPAASYAEATRLLDEDQAHALVADYPYCFYAVLRNPAKQYIASITPITYEPLGIAMPGDDPLLINLVTNFLNTMRSSGQMDLLKERWFGDSSWMRRMPN